MYGFYRIGAAVPKLHLGNPARNVREILRLYRQASNERITAVVFPELCLTGYTLADLFFQERLYRAQNEALEWLLEQSRDFDTLAAVGMMLRVDDRLYNVAAVIQRGEILGIIPKSYIPDKREFYEKRQFDSGREIVGETVTLFGREVPFGVDLIFRDEGEFRMGVEICEDLWALTPPSNLLAASGANLILNLSASNELAGKADYRAELVRTQSARLVCVYAYASSGPGESSTDTVFGGDSMIAEYGSLLARGERFRFESQLIAADVDLRKLTGLREAETGYCDAPRRKMRRINVAPLPRPDALRRPIDPHPFVPGNPADRNRRCEEISAIQAHALIRRMKQARIRRAVLGISGGLDSTLALLATWKAFQIMERDPSEILAVTMPGFGTTGRTYANAVKLCQTLGVELREVPIQKLALAEFEAIGHDPETHDVTYENVQARARTEILMNLANKEHGLVVGTGDLSEIALGFSTYNGDHMSMYALNSGIPKTLVRYLVEYYARIHPELSDVLGDILSTPVSPELLPAEEGQIAQKTEEIVGPYELHDFFLYHFIKYGAEPAKILYLATLAFDGRYDEATIRKWLRLFLRRFFTQQFKRSCMPDGPKVGTISLSPRADWRMPSDANVDAWLAELDD
ncbi:NAD(+) synthase [Nitratifractor salsuginis]|uniref:Glutamine-dependent NAD(+) synthetase n=1 Tax=Nitratifractor salsuginis (strain DSM 16511 / JCM 12458 / E9I37-1) TaxID=749222 RepID=E6X326_NITSE|nr:NAD(+) synthase [Nitratifractor salsuginis]ADV46170.1 NH(3)-dependent NAD(+) synthetase [Nitratifractor salsuginis DSM 16511]